MSTVSLISMMELLEKSEGKVGKWQTSMLKIKDRDSQQGKK